MAVFDPNNPAELRFSREFDQSGNPVDLVFGEEGGSTAPEYVVYPVGNISAMGGHVGVRVALKARTQGNLSAMEGRLVAHWDANVSRNTRVELGSDWQEADSISHPSRTHWQETEQLQSACGSRWQEAVLSAAAVAPHWQETAKLRVGTRHRWEVASPLRNAIASQWDEAVRLRHAAGQGWQEAIRRRAAARFHYQETLRLRGAVSNEWQDAIPVRAAALSIYGPADETSIALLQHWQEAIRPPSGESSAPKPPVEPPCWNADLPADLLFSTPWADNANLFFVCCKDDGPNPGETIVVPIRRVYMTVNSALLFRLDNGYAIPTTGMRLALDWGNWTWSFSASVRGYDFNKLRSPDGRPVLVRAFINGNPYDFAIEKVGPSRTFSGSAIEISGRGLSAELDEAESGTRSFSNDIAMSALQLVGQVLTDNGASIGWSVDTWQPTDWMIPAGVFSHAGSYISAVNTIAEAVGAYVQPKDTERKFDVFLKYPKPHWEWNTVTPDIQLPSNVVSFEGIEFATPNQYNRVFVLGQEHGVHGQYTRFGTPGDIVAPTVIDPLVTSVEVVRQRGRSIVSAGGPVVSLKLPVLAETGIIKPGKFIRYVDNGIERIGISRSVSVDVALPTIYQTIGVETHGY